jgi:hypothetical protein
MKFMLALIRVGAGFDEHSDDLRVAVLLSYQLLQRRRVEARAVWISAAIEQQSYDVAMTCHRCRDQRRRARSRLASDANHDVLIEIGAGLEQAANVFCIPSLDRTEDRRLSLVVGHAPRCSGASYDCMERISLPFFVQRKRR